ncbi:carotenoid biosynthesis protein [Micromonospora sp. NPDC003197]
MTGLPATAPVTGANRARLSWLLLVVLVVAQIGYPLTEGVDRARLTVVTVLLGYLLSVGHALITRGPRTAGALVLITTGGGLAVEIVGIAIGVPFGVYEYSGQLGPAVAGVPLVIPLAWTWMAWPAWLVAVRLTRPGFARIALAGWALAAWDVFLDPQMVSEGYWTWRDPSPVLPGVPGIPLSNYLGWLLVAVAFAGLLRLAAGPGVAAVGDADAPMYGLYLWTFASSVLAHAVFLGLPASAFWGALAMSPVAVPLAVAVARRHRAGRIRPAT